MPNNFGQRNLYTRIFLDNETHPSDVIWMKNIYARILPDKEIYAGTLPDKEPYFRALSVNRISFDILKIFQDPGK